MTDETTPRDPAPASAGSHGEPDAWAAVGRDGRLLWAERRREMVARYVVDGTPIVPLYRQPQPTLTDDERAAIGAGISALKWHVAWESKEIASLEALRDRLK